jgi:hypothetical protein
MGVNKIMSRESGPYQEIISKLERKNKREYALLALSGAVITLLLGTALFFTFSLLESIFHFNSTARTILFFIFVFFTISSAAFLFLLPLLKYFAFFRKTDYHRTAAEVGRYYPLIKDDLLNAMQLVEGDKRLFYSPILIDAAFKKVYERSRDIQFERIVSFSRVKNLLLYSSAAIVFMLLFLVFVPGLQASSYRLYNFEREFTAPPEFTLQVIPGDAEVSKGDNVEITVIASGKIPQDVFIALKTEEQAEFENQKLVSDSGGVFVYNLNSIRSSLNYYAFSGNIRSDLFRIDVMDKPIVKSFEIVVRPPAYSGLPEIIQKDNGNITTLKGSNVSLRLSSNKELREAYLQFSDTARNDLNINYSTAAGSFRVMKDDQYRINLSDISGSRNESPVGYTIRSENDAYPVIEMVEPGQDVNLGNDNRVPIEVKIADDFGFSRLVLNYRLSASKYESPHEEYTSVEIPITGKSREADVNYIWNLSSLSLGTNDVMSYYLEIFDNDRISGPKSSRTSVYNIRVPSLDEILASADKKQTQVATEMQKTLKEAEELKRTLDKIDNDLKKDKKELSWEEKEKLENALDKFEQLQDRMKDSGKEMDELQKEMQKNNLLSKETLEKYMELQKLFDEMSGEEYKKAMEQMREMLQKMDRKSAQDALQDMKVNEENFKKSIERTINLLKRVRIEQKMDELVKRSEEVDKTLDELMNENNSKNAQNKQDNLTEQLKDIKDQLDKLAEDMDGMSDMPKEEMEQAADEFEKQKNEELSKQAAENMKQNKMQQAKQQQSQLSKNMKNFSQQMQQMQEQMQQQNQMQVLADMMKVLENTITLSKQQEELKTETQSASDSPLNKNAERQSNLQRNLDNLMKQLGEMSQKTFAITPEMGKSLGDARREMMKSLQAMQTRNSHFAANSQGEAMKSLNEAATMMQSSMEAMMQGGGQGGMMSLMQQMGQMAQQQMGLNNLTQKLQEGNQGQLTPSEQAELQRISQQQELIKKSLEELNKEAKRTGESKKIPANLENIVKQMEEVISDMNTRNLDDKLIQKQERILSRLLDAQRSLNERDFEKQRESFTGENIVRESPSELNLRSGKERDRIKDELNRAVSEGYKKDYENLIKKYFEELQKENN